MKNYNMMNIRLKTLFESKICSMQIVLDTLSEISLEQYKRPKLDGNKLFRELSPIDQTGVIFEVLSNPMEQFICSGLILSMYGEMENCLMEIVRFIERKTKIPYKHWSVPGARRKTGELKKIRAYIERYSTIKLNKGWMEEAISIGIIRNSIIHNGSILKKCYISKKEDLEPYAILEAQIPEMVFISEDFNCLYNVLRIIRNLLMDISEQNLEVILNEV